MMVIDYLYRDASNYKDFRRYLLEGSLTEAQIKEITSKLDEGLYFVPEDVGLPMADNLQRTYGYDEEVDHPFHELVLLKNISEEEAEKEDCLILEITAEELYDAFTHSSAY